MADASATEDEQEIRQSLLYATGSICEEDIQRQLRERPVTHAQRRRPEPSKATLALLADLLHKEVEIMATELQHFAHHANRRVIKPEDVVLCARNDANLVRALQKFQREQLPSNAAKKRRRPDE